MMPSLYPSWFEIPVSNLDRALAFYRGVFELSDTPRFDDPPATIALLLPSDKSVRAPGVSLVRSPLHKPTDGGGIVNFHLGGHDALEKALGHVREYGGQVDMDFIDTGDGVRYINLLDSEGNRIALSSYEPLDGTDE